MRIGIEKSICENFIGIIEDFDIFDRKNYREDIKKFDVVVCENLCVAFLGKKLGKKVIVLETLNNYNKIFAFKLIGATIISHPEAIKDVIQRGIKV